MSKTLASIRTAPVYVSLALAVAVSDTTLGASSAMADTASDALVTLATTGNPDPLHKELGGTVISSAELQEESWQFAKLGKNGASGSQVARYAD